MQPRAAQADKGDDSWPYARANERANSFLQREGLMRFAVLSTVLVLQIGLSIPAGAQTAAGSAPAGKPTIVPIDRTHVRLALPERAAQAQARPRGAAPGAAGARSAPLLPPAAKAR